MNTEEKIWNLLEFGNVDANIQGLRQFARDEWGGFVREVCLFISVIIQAAKDRADDFFNSVGYLYYCQLAKLNAEWIYVTVKNIWRKLDEN